MATRLTDVREFPRSVELDDDKGLVLAFQSGDIDAYSDIFVKYRALSAQICYRILQDREEADEAVQETMLRVYRGLGTFNGRYQLQAWVARIATNVSLDMVRARSRRPQRDPLTPDITENARLTAALTDDPSEAVERVLDQEEIRSILSSIPDNHREALVLREFEGRSHEEIGEALGVSPQQAKALIHRAKKSFRRAWDRSGERRGVAALAPIMFLSRFRMPGFLRRLWQPAHDVVASATATAQQAAVTVTAAPAVTQGAVSMADKVTAAAITVIVAGTVSVGARDPAHAEAVEADAGDRIAGPRAFGRASCCPTSGEGDAEVEADPPPRAPEPPRGARSGWRHIAVADDGAESNALAVSRWREFLAWPDSRVLRRLLPPPTGDSSFHSSVDFGTPQLSLVDSHVLGGTGGDLTFGQTIQGDTVDQTGKPFGFVNIEYNGEVSQGVDSLFDL